MDSWVWVGGVALAVGGLIVGGYVGMNLLGSVSDTVEGPPTLVSKELSWGEVSEEETTIQADLEIHNPNGLTVQFRNVNTTIQASGIEVGNAASPGFELAENQTSPANATARLDNQAVLDWWSVHTANGERSEVTMDFQLEIGEGPIGKDIGFDINQPVETDVAGKIERAAESDPSGCPDKEHHYHPPEQDEDNRYHLHFPCIVEATNSWDGTDRQATTIVSKLNVYNPNREPGQDIFIEDLGLRALLHDIPVVEGHIIEPVQIPPGEVKTVTVRAQADQGRVQEWWPLHVNGECERSPLDAEIILKVGFWDEEETVPLPIDEAVSTNLIC